MFGMGFTEIMIIAVIAVIFLGPDKLPEAMINIAKFFRSFKNTLSDAKNSIEQEMNISDLKKEALSYKNQITETTSEIDRIKDMANLDLPDLDELTPTPSAKAEEIESAVEEEKAVTFKKKKNKAEKTEPVKKEIESEED
jgi:sec-independent protein translocase protein TatB